MESSAWSINGLSKRFSTAAANRLKLSAGTADNHLINFFFDFIKHCRRFSRNNGHIACTEFFNVLFFKLQRRVFGFDRINPSLICRVSRLHSQTASAGANVYHNVFFLNA